MLSELAVEKVCFIIVKAREFDAAGGEPSDDASNPSDDRFVSALTPANESTTQRELTAFINALDEDEQTELVALLFVGRGDYTPEEWDDALAAARDRVIHRQCAFCWANRCLAIYSRTVSPLSTCPARISRKAGSKANKVETLSTARREQMLAPGLRLVLSDQFGLLAVGRLFERRLDDEAQAMQDRLVCSAQCAPQDVARVAARGTIEPPHRFCRERSRRQPAIGRHMTHTFGKRAADAGNSRLGHLFVRARMKDVIHQHGAAPFTPVSSRRHRVVHGRPL